MIASVLVALAPLLQLSQLSAWMLTCSVPGIAPGKSHNIEICRAGFANG